MNVLMVTNMYPSDANPVFGVFVARQVAALRELGVDVRLVANTDERGGARSLIKYISLLVRALLAALRGDVDIVVGHFLYPTAWIASLCARIARAPYVVVAHGTDVSSASGSGFLARRTRAALLGADGVVAVSSALGSRLRNELGVMAETTVHIVHMGVDLDVFRLNPGARESLGWPPAERVVLFVGNLVPVKGPDVLLEAFSALRSRDVTDGLEVVGDGPMAESLRVAAREYGIADAVTFAGRLDSASVALRLAAADVVAMPSRNEGLGLVAMEALACGTPVVASRVGGLAEVFPGAECGAFVEPDDARALAGALEQVLVNGKERYSESCARAVRPHSVRVKAEAFIDVLKEVSHGAESR